MLESLRESLKAASVDAIRQDNLADAQMLMNFAQQVSEMQARWLLPGTKLERGDGEELEGERLNLVDRKRAKYFTDGGYLVKKGLRRDKRSFYVQKTGRESFEEILAALQEFTSKEFTVQEFLPSVRAPSYQVYMVVSALERLGALESRRRGFFRFTNSDAFRREYRQIWARLPKKGEDGDAENV